MPVFYNLNSVEKREVLVVIMQIIRNLDDSSLAKAWQQSIARTRLFFKLLEECLILFEVSNQMKSIMHILQKNSVDSIIIFLMMQIVELLCNLDYTAHLTMLMQTIPIVARTYILNRSFFIFLSFGALENTSCIFALSMKRTSSGCYSLKRNLIFTVLQHRKAADSLLMSCSSRSPDVEAPASPKYSDRLSPAINTYLSEASRQEIRV